MLQQEAGQQICRKACRKKLTGGGTEAERGGAMEGGEERGMERRKVGGTGLYTKVDTEKTWKEGSKKEGGFPDRVYVTCHSRKMYNYARKHTSRGRR
jgi:hypothetical protein